MVDFSSQSPSMLACSVVGDVDPVALLAPSMSVLPVSPEHEVVSREGVSVSAVSLSGFGMNSVADLIQVVIPDCSVLEVGGDVIELVAVKVPDYLPLTSLSKKSKSYESMSFEGSSPLTVVVNCDVGVPTITDERLDRTTPSALAPSRNHLARTACSVVAEAGDRKKFFCSVSHKPHCTDIQNELTPDTERNQ